MLKGQVALGTLRLLFLFCSVSANASSTPSEWRLPSGWHIDHSVKQAVAEGDLTGTGVQAGAALLTNGRDVRLIVFVNYQASSYRAYDVFEEPKGDLQSRRGISIVASNGFELEPGSTDCTAKWIHCTADKRVFFRPSMPALWLEMGEWGGSVFKWIDYNRGFERFSVGD